MNSGIYQIINKVNGKFYIGSAVWFDARFRMHKRSLRLNIHANAYLQKAYNKHGSDAFVFMIVERCEKEKLLEREQHWLDCTKACEIGYNILKIAGSTIGLNRKPEVWIHCNGWDCKCQLCTAQRKEYKRKWREARFIPKPRELWSTKWPHKGASHCKCSECLPKRNEQRRKLYHKSKKLKKPPLLLFGKQVNATI